MFGRLVRKFENVHQCFEGEIVRHLSKYRLRIMSESADLNQNCAKNSKQSIADVALVSQKSEDHYRDSSNFAQHEMIFYILNQIQNLQISARYPRKNACRSQRRSILPYAHEMFLSHYEFISPSGWVVSQKFVTA